MKIKEKVLVIPSWMQIYEKRIKFFIVITGLDLSRALVASEAFPLLASRKKGEKKKKSHLSSSLSFSLCSLRASSSARLYAVFKRSLLILLLDPLLRFQAFLSPKTRTLGYHLPIRFLESKILIGFWWIAAADGIRSKSDFLFSTTRTS